MGTTAWTGTVRTVCASGCEFRSLQEAVDSSEWDATIHVGPGLYIETVELRGAVTMVPTLLAWGSDWQKENFIPPAIHGEHIWCQGYSEPNAGSDLASLRTRAELVGDEWVINGQKVWTSQAHLANYMFMLVRTEPDAPKHAKFSSIIVPTDTEGYELARVVPTMGTTHGAHCEIWLKDVHVPKENLLGPRGAGFVIAQKRLGPGRIFHCMRWLGQAQRAFDLMCERANSRVAFGKTLGQHQQIQKFVFDSLCEIQASRMLTLSAAHKIDQGDEARIEMTGRPRRDGRRDDARSVQPIGVAIGREITAHRAELEAFPSRLGRRLENRGLPCAGRPHQIDRQQA